MLAGLALVLYCVAGWRLSTCCLFPSGGERRLQWLNAALGVLFGLGTASLVRFLSLLAFGTRTPGLLPWLEVAGLLLVAALARPRGGSWPPARAREAPRWLWLGFATALVAGLAALAVRTFRTPLGSHDAWAMWTYRAVGLGRLDGSWAEVQAFLRETPAPDYPLLLPLTTLRFAESMGGWQPLAPQLTSGLFVLCATIVLTAGLVSLRGGAVAALAGILFLGTRELAKTASGQFADLPIAALQVTSLVLFAAACRESPRRSAQLIACGFTAGLMAWTKNEGLAYLVALGLTMTVIPVRLCGAPRRQRIGCLLAGAAPALICTALFKHGVSIDNEVLGSERLAPALEQLADLERWRQVASGLAGAIVKFGSGGLLLVPVALLLWCRAGRRPLDNEARVMILVFAVSTALVLSAATVIYVLSPFEVEVHLGWSLSRVLLQYWPGLLFVTVGALRPD